MNTQEMQTRIAELEQIIENKKQSLSKTSFRSWYCRANEVFELCNLESQVKNAQVQQQRQNSGNAAWRNDPATSRQISYLSSLGVKIETGMTKGRASTLIDAAKEGSLGSVGGFYRDGSN